MIWGMNLVSNSTGGTKHTSTTLCQSASRRRKWSLVISFSTQVLTIIRSWGRRSTIWSMWRFSLGVRPANSLSGQDGSEASSDTSIVTSSFRRPTTRFSSTTSRLTRGSTASARVTARCTSGHQQICSGHRARTAYLPWRKAMTRLILMHRCSMPRMRNPRNNLSWKNLLSLAQETTVN